MVNDLDRTPIAYAMKSSSLTNKVFQEMTNKLIAECKKRAHYIGHIKWRTVA